MSAMMTHFPIISVVCLFLGAFLVAILGRKSAVVRNILVAISVTVPLVLILSLIPSVMLRGEVLTYWMGNWEPIAGWAIGICMEVDALSLFFALIVTLAVFVAAIYSFTYMKYDDSLENYFTLFLMLSGSVLGLVLSGDLFNIFVMIEIMTMTAVALTAFRTTYDGALEGAMKYMVVGSIGSTSILVGIALLYSQLHTLNLAQITALLPNAKNPVTVAAFAFLFLGFATKACLFPFHPLDADTLTVAPNSVAVVIAGVLTKCGVYGIVRLCYSVFGNIDETSVQVLVTLFGALSMFICVTMAFNQHNFNRLLAFHSISQVGYVITAAGLSTALGLQAGLFHAVNHTLFKGLLFLTAGAVYYATGSLDLDKLGGLSKKMPRTTILFLIGAASISGLPPFNGFASKWMIYQAIFERATADGNFYFVIAAVLALLSSVLTLASFIKVSQSVFFGQLNPEFEKAKEVPVAMRIPMWILAALCILTGVYPQFVQHNLLVPASTAAMDAVKYVDSALGAGTASNAGVSQIVTYLTYQGGAVSQWDPVAWLWLLLVITCAVCLVAVLGTPEKKVQDKTQEATDKVLLMEAKDPRYESFFSGEQAVYSQAGGSDLFWGFKHNWKPYFEKMGAWHSGIVSDYTLYGVVAMAFVLLFAIIFNL